MWNRITLFFSYSETIFWARLQVLLSIVVGVMTYVDPHLVAGVIPVEWVSGWLLLSGLATEWLRRRRSNL